ncbi:Thioredoxin family protein [Histomonas meleagridis]|uniref:Thioredoxin family protein n=1 Tax=Histomonas meleagridis TaxID=135588 RepID=UPI0035595E1F|nr:Thioredoxin family protein [Histomonas meleagridis]KAH0799484.1 Thioredoxin family protein [Histomonas meleagridis]
MLHSESCQHCVRLLPTWNQASELGDGITNWAELDCSLNRTACQELHTEGVPRLLFFTNGTIYEYREMQLARLLVNWVSAFLQDTAIVVDRNNYTQSISENAAILFTEKPTIPKIWAGIEKKLGMSDVKFFVSNDQKLFDELKLENFPGIYVKKGEEITCYKGKLTIREAAEFFRKQFEPNKEL